MNRNKLKAYAPKARRDFIKAVTDRAAFYGLTKEKTDPVTVLGDVAIINGKPFPKDVADKRKRLEERITREGFEQVMEAMAYTWFNRFVAIRFMELHGYMEHGYRVLSHPEGNTVPEIVEHAQHVDLPGLDQEKVIELKLDGTKEAALYRMLLIAQCNALHKAMPFLFEKIGGYTELLMPDNLLHSNSPIRNLVNEIPEENWQEIEIIGWLYQFYISEKKDQVIGKVVKSEDIPAATQLFTPNWIVKYMVQNSLGAQWLATYPNSPLKGQMEYYIEPSEQTEKVKTQLTAITPNTLDPEALTLMDPACGSGHILVEAYELFKAIYLERGYRHRDVAKLILEKNLFGLDIDERAAQLASFALMMKARADDRRIFGRGIKLHVMAFQETKGVDAHKITQTLNMPIIKGDPFPRESLFEEIDEAKRPLFSKENISVEGDIDEADIAKLIALFEHGKTFGSLIFVPQELQNNLDVICARVEDVLVYGGMLGRAAAEALRPTIEQTQILANKYDAIVANPPYMGSKGMNSSLKKFAKDKFPEAKSDLFACFIERGNSLASNDGHNSMVTMQSWMFLSSFQRMRERVLREKTIGTMAHLGARAFGSISGEVVQTSSFVLKNCPIKGYKPVFFRLLDGGEEDKRRSLVHGKRRFDHALQDEFGKIPGSPLAYWLSVSMIASFGAHSSLAEVAMPKEGLNTTNNDRFLRRWWECDRGAVKFDSYSASDAVSSEAKWFPCQKGGSYRKWYGNNEYVVNWHDNGREIKSSVIERYGSASKRVVNEHLYFKEGISWSAVSSTVFAMRHVPLGHIFETAGSMCFFNTKREQFLGLAFCNSCIVMPLLQCLSPTLSFKPGPIGKLPLASTLPTENFAFAGAAVRSARADWNDYERSWDFQSLPILTASSDPTPALESSYTNWITQNRDTIAEMKRLEEENNRLFIDAYGLADELTPDVPIEQITLTVNPAYRYGGKISEEEQWTRFRQDTMKELVSYAIGCMMGRYSLNEPGLIYAHSGGEGFDICKYTTFPADEDGVIPITDTDWFDDDACHRLIEFISVAWDAEHLENNLTFLADNLLPRKNESSRETLRRYLCDRFFKDHLQAYKKRPIYWLFSSGKLRAFQCLVYLHRYNEGTLSRMRTEYVIPLQGKMAARIEQLSGDINAATSTAHRKKLERENDKLVKQQTELQTFDEKLRHYADQRISLDLDDGVKVNYGKFGDLLADVKAVTGKKK